MRFNFRTTAAALMATTVATALAACGTQSEEAQQNAVAVGGTFDFVSPGGETEIRYAPEDRAPLQEFSGDSLMEEGTEIALSDFEGQIVVLNSWGQWCAPCRAEADDLQRIQEKMQADGSGTVLGINVKDYNRQIAQDFVTDNGLEYPSIYDPPFRSAIALGGVPTSVVPTTIILDKQHRPAAVFLTEITDNTVLDVVEELKKEA